MSEKLYQLVLDHLRAGKPEADLMNCGCMGCMNRVNGICACEQAGYSPNGVRRPCKCSCQLPEVAERNRQAGEQMAGYVARAREEIAGEVNS